MTNAETQAALRRFYEAFARRDGETMAALYAPDATFEDPVFRLTGSDIGKMWVGLMRGAKDFSVQFTVAKAGAGTGVVEWTARYLFGGRKPVVNVIVSEIEMKDGLIVRQKDTFDFPRWAAQALGVSGHLFGRTEWLRRSVSKRAAARLGVPPKPGEPATPGVRKRRLERGARQDRMPTDWKSLAKETVHSFDADDIRGMWNVDWRRAARVFVADHEDEIAAERRRWKKDLRKTNAIVFGLAKRLAPPRRLVFALALLLTLLAFVESFGGDSFSAQASWAFFALFVSVLALAFLLAMELVDKLHFKDELVMARELQAQLVPRVLPEIGAFELGAFNRIANTVGGDLYAFEPLADGRLAVLFGDASGHGMAAGLVMAVTHAVFRTQLPVDPSPAAMIESLNRVLAETGNARSFFAGIYALLEPGGDVTATVAGHPPVLKLDAEGRIVARLGTGSYPLGIKRSVKYLPVTTFLAPGEMLLFHSDGLSEARGANGEEFGDARIEHLLFRKPGAEPYEAVSALAADLDLFLGRVAAEDDVSIAAVRRRSA